MSSVRVKMESCGNDHSVTVSRNKDGKFDVTIETECQNVRSYAKMVTEITMNDIMGSSESIIQSYDSTRVLTPSCLIPAAVMTAAWMEIGMLPEERMKSIDGNSISAL